MKLKNIYQHSQNLSECLRQIQTLLEEKEIAKSKLQYWSEREDLMHNASDAITKISQIDGMIALQEYQLVQIINQLNIETINYVLR